MRLREAGDLLIDPEKISSGDRVQPDGSLEKLWFPAAAEQTVAVEGGGTWHLTTAPASPRLPWAAGTLPVQPAKVTRGASVGARGIHKPFCRHFLGLALSALAPWPRTGDPSTRAGRCPEHSKALRSILGLYALDTRGTVTPVIS